MARQLQQLEAGLTKLREKEQENERRLYGASEADGAMHAYACITEVSDSHPSEAL